MKNDLEQDVCSLIERAANDDETAITHLLFMNYDALIQYVRPLVPVHLQSQIDPEDILQEAVTVAWQKISAANFENESAFLRLVKHDCSTQTSRQSTSMQSKETLRIGRFS